MELAWEEWTGEIQRCLQAVPDELLATAAEWIHEAGLVLTAGNGGSSSLASHMAQAIAKPAYKAGGGIATACLTDNTPTLTAHANDGGWKQALVETARPYFPGPLNSVLIVFSSSGESENIVKLAKLALSHRWRVIAFTGFNGGPLQEIAQVKLHVPSDDYEVVEPVHDALLHRVQYHLRALNAGLESA